MADETTSPESAEETPRALDPLASKPTKPKKRLSNADEDEKRVDRVRMRRRDAVLHMMAGFLTLNLFAAMKFFFPRTLFEPKTKFTIGYPTDYEIGVDTKWQASRRIWVVKNTEGIFVVLAKYTHLGCTPDWKGVENKFKCPCHGSGFTAEGINFEGPAPRPLDRCSVELNASGEMVVDKLRLFRADQFDSDGALLRT
jgi:cytochrome b6-f complex iron-sulfur subunit